MLDCPGSDSPMTPPRCLVIVELLGRGTPGTRPPTTDRSDRRRLPRDVRSLTPRRALPAVRGRHPPMAEHNTHFERTADASGGYAFYGRCSCGWYGHLRV